MGRNVLEKNQQLKRSESLEEIQQVINNEYESKVKLNGERSAWDRPLKWSNIILLTIFHIACIWAFYIVCVNDVKFKTFQFAALIGALTGISFSAGAHRYWSHRSFKSTIPLKIFFLLFHAMSMDGSTLKFARDHRCHHKYSDTDADPDNSARGVFYSHIGWWLVKKNEFVKMGGKRLNYSDLYDDPLVVFQHKYYNAIFIIFGVIVPTIIPVYFWNEDPLVAFSACVLLRIFVVLHHFFAVSSLAHLIGYRPYDFRILPTDHRFVNYITLGEGNHNYHHVFPFDYRSNEKVQWETFNPPIMFIQLCSAIGLAYDLKIASKAVFNETLRRRGVKPIKDEKKSLKFRIVNAIFDWICGLLVTLWISYIPILFKIWTNRQLIC